MTLKNQLIYFPYLRFGYDPIKFGGMLLWDFDRHNQITDKSLKDYIEKLIKANTFNGRPIQNIAILSENPPIFQHSQKKINLAEELRGILFICTVAEGNIRQGEGSRHNVATSENFTHIFQNFILNNEYTAISSGAIVQINDGGYVVGKVKYEKPPYVLQGNYRIDEKLFSSLKTLKRKKIETYRRILRAVDAFMSGYFNSYELSNESRVLQQSRAFEILLQIPEKEQRKHFKERVRQYCFPKEPKYQRQYSYWSERAGGRKESEKNIMAVMWADKFYTLRNHIIHGEKVKTKDFLFKSQRHWDISLWIFLVLVKKIINEVLQRERFYDQIVWKEGKFEYEKDSFYRVILKALEEYKGKRK